MNLTIILTVCEDYDECQATIKSIRETAGDISVVVVDDASSVPLTLLDSKAKLVRNDIRIGVAASREIGSIHAQTDFILLCDAHMRFSPGWYEAALKAMEAGNTVAHNCTCLQLTPFNMEVSKPDGEYTSGASINFYGPDRVNPNAPYQILEGVWNPQHGGDSFPVACMMGATYLLPKEFFHHVGGLRLLKGWGSDEPFLSLKWWLAGGEIRACKTVRIGHQFRTSATYKTESYKPIYNKLLTIHTCFPPDRARKLIALMPNSREFTEAKRHIEEDWNIIASEQAYYDSIFVRDFDWYLQWFGLTCP